MNPSPAPLTHKLILGILLLIFVCLALLVLKVYWPGWMRRDAGQPVATVSPSDSADANAHGQVGSSEPTNIVRRRVMPTNQLAFSPARVAQSSTDIRPDEPVISPSESKPVVEINDARQTLAPIVVNQAILPANAATGSRSEIVGRVTLSGTPPREVPIDLGPMCGPLHSGPPPTTRHYVVNRDGGLANVLVFVFRPPESGPGSREGFIEQAQDLTAVMAANSELVGQRLAGSMAAPTTPALIDQVGCMFEPYITAVQVGQPLSIRNSDPVLHNIHATPRLNREFNFGQPAQGRVNAKSFDKAEVFIRLKCDVHQWMFAYVSVLAHPFFSVTDEDGVYRIPSGLRPGRYRLAAVHLKTGTIYRDVTVDSAGATRADVVFRIASAPRQTSNRRP